MQNIVAIEIEPETNQAIVWKREESGETLAYEEPFRPWLVSMFKRADYGAQARQLSGDSAIKWLHSYPTCEAYKKADDIFPYGKSVVYDDMRNQFLIQHPEYHLFDGMKFDELRRMAVDIETTGLNPEKDQILIVAWATPDHSDVISGDEAEIILDLNTLLYEYNPDTIEGHNIFGFDIPFLMRRAEILGLELKWGRGEEAVVKGKKYNFRVGSYDRPVQSYKAFGRHIIDSMLVAMRYDSNTGGTFENYSLKYIANELGVAAEERIILDRSKMAEEYLEHPEVVELYACQDVEETLAIVEMMVQPEFYLTTLVPDTFQNLLLTGGASKVNLLLIADYIRNGYSIPTPPGERTDYEGGFVDCREFGVFKGVAKVDVSSLYPSIMLNAPNCAPSQDELDSFRRTLRELTAKRLAIKAKAKEADADKKYLDGQDKGFKILINSYYGYLAVGLHFSDYDAASNITRVGRKIVGDMSDQLEALGQKVIEVDTDGVYFQYTDKGILEYIPAMLSLPDFVTVDVEEPFDAMLSVKAKNYVLSQGGKLHYHGNSLRSRRDEKFGREFISDMVGHLLKDKPEWILPTYQTYVDKIVARQISKYDLVKRERISYKTLTSDLKKKLAAAAELAEAQEGDYVSVYQNENNEYIPVEMYAKDEDRYFYLGRLWKFAERLDSVLVVYDMTLPKIYKKDFYLMAGLEKPQRQKKVA